MVLPLLDRGLERGIGAVVLGISSRRPFDHDYREWFGLIAAQISASIANARAVEDERRRAEALAEIDRAKTAFFSNVSHEFRTPLTLLLGPVEDALLTDERSLQGESLETAHRNALRMLKLVNSLLDFSRLEAGRATARYQPTDLATLTTDLASTFRTPIEQAGLRYTVDCVPLDEPVFVDRDMWEKIVLNLLSNAFKHTFEGEIAVTLRPAGGGVALAVRDTGIGIATDQLPHLFERFHRVSQARSRTQEGTGIGLALVQELVKLHQGRVSVESIAGSGTAFTVWLPTGHRHLPLEHVASTASDTDAPATRQAFVEEALRWLPTGSSEVTDRQDIGGKGVGGRIVVVDDNADMRDYVTRLLRPAWQVESFADAAAALDAIRRARPDLVISDVMLPGMDGFALLNTLRADHTLRHVPVILLSARAGEEARVEGLQAGADDYLVKPFGARELVARVTSAIELSRVRQQGHERLSKLNRDLKNRIAELETLLKVIPVGIGIALDRDCRTIQVNSALGDMLGLPVTANASLTAPIHERPVGFRVRDHRGVEIAADDLPMQVAAREGREIRDLELDVVRQDGRVVRLLEYAAPLFDEHGEPRGSIGAFVDITERRQAEARNQFLVRFDDTVRALADPVAIMAFATELLGTHLGVSRCVYADVEPDGDHFVVPYEYTDGTTSESLLGRWSLSDFSERVASTMRRGELLVVRDYARELPEDAPRFLAHDMSATICASHIRDHQLSTMLAVHSALPRNWRADEIELVQLVADRCWESIARARAVRALADSESRYRILFDSIDSGFCTCQLLVDDQGTPIDYRFLEVNQRFEELTSLKEAAGKTARELVPDLEPHWVQFYGMVVSTGEPVHFEHSSRLTGKWFDVYAFRFGQPQNRTFGIIFSDISERKQIEASLRQMNRLKDEFLATLSHELRTPLNAVLGWTHLIRTGALRKDALTKAFDSLERNAKAQAQLVDDLLDVSRIISGKLQIRNDEVNLYDVIAAAIETIRPTALNKGVRLRFKARRRPAVVVRGDADRVRQIAWNLLSNAVKFTAAGGLAEISLTSDGGQAEIVVRDTGQGISPDFLPYVFDRFRQADGTTTRRHGGLGLGLAIVRHLVEAHGGTATAASDGVDQGASFTIQLPLATPTSRPAKASPPRRQRAKPLKGLRILAVDDEPDAREVLQTILLGEGAKVTMTSSAGEALHRLQGEPFDVLLADIGMPDEDGLALIRAIRGLAQPLKTLPAIAVTAYAGLRDRELAIRAGYGWHVAKPIDPTQLIIALTAAIATRTDAAEGERRPAPRRATTRRPRVKAHRRPRS
jgi:signal transduction histidine kinase/DNA-binding response OmpR family regulator